MIALSLVAARSLFYAVIGGFETRYMIPAFPVIEATTLLTLAVAWPRDDARISRRT